MNLAVFIREVIEDESRSDAFHLEQTLHCTVTMVKVCMLEYIVAKTQFYELILLHIYLPAVLLNYICIQYRNQRLLFRFRTTDI